MHFSCQCLNVTISVLELFDDRETLNQFLRPDLTQLVDGSNEWIVCAVSSNQFAQIKWQSLNKTISIRDTTVNRCLACQQFTHIVSDESSRILINKNLLNEKTIKNALCNENYSSIAKIILPRTKNQFDATRFQSQQSLDDFSRREQDAIQQAFRQALDDAERETEEKIRSFQREQEQILEEQNKLLNRQLETLLDLIRSANRLSTTNKISAPLHNSSSYINENSMESGFGSDIFDSSNANDWSRQSSMAERSQSERNSNLDDETNLENLDWPKSSTNPLNFASSLPKEIAFRSISTAQKDDDSNDLERIAKSFRQLSQSLMCTDGTEVFGDLPSPRFNLRAT